MIASLRNHDFTSFGIFCIGLGLFTIGLSQQEIVGFESRFYLFALEMWRHGLSLFPTTYGVPYPDYPLTTTLLIYGMAKLFGHLNKFTAVLPSAIAAAITLATTYSIGALHAKRWGLLAVFFMLLTNTFLMEARTISPDGYVAMVTVLSFYLVYSANLSQKVRRLGCIPVLLFFGFACRGPIGLVVPAGVVCVFYLLDRNWKLFLIMGLVALLMLLLGSSLLFGAAYHVGGVAFVNEVWYTEVAGRLQDAHLPWYFYFSESLGAYALTFPLAILILAGLFFQREKVSSGDYQFILKLLAWVLVIMIVLTIPAGKKIRYILAMVPALSLISAALFVLPLRAKYQLYLQKIVYGMCVCLPLFCLIFIMAAWSYLLQHSNMAAMHILRGIEPNMRLAIFLLLLLQGLGFAGRKFRAVGLGMAALTFVSFYILIIEPINLALNQGRVFVTAVEAARHQQHAKLVFYQENPDGTPIKYLINMLDEDRPLFISSVAVLEKMNEPAYFIADPKAFSKLPPAILKSVQIVNTGSVGHNPLVVFQKTQIHQ